MLLRIILNLIWWAEIGRANCFKLIMLSHSNRKKIYDKGYAQNNASIQWVINSFSGRVSHNSSWQVVAEHFLTCTKILVTSAFKEFLIVPKETWLFRRNINML